ncbi:HigA family addiction module antitoxin [Acidicapsa dinghuensis]|uniref:HigA family addiction module antitoxin n=1 Tax=Acidicapsa dinghuensis TaxID=2218256 RepID=A0ABW1EKQ0_9BACT|nr:HigA family addiction module antitoxin [Acidicapsa dinghuensis]
MASRMFNPCHPGEILRNEFDGKSDADTAALLSISANELRAIYEGREDITVEMAGKLDEVTHTSEGFWLRLQRLRDEWLRDPRSKSFERIH